MINAPSGLSITRRKRRQLPRLGHSFCWASAREQSQAPSHCRRSPALCPGNNQARGKSAPRECALRPLHRSLGRQKPPDPPRIASRDSSSDMSSSGTPAGLALTLPPVLEGRGKHLRKDKFSKFATSGAAWGGRAHSLTVAKGAESWADPRILCHRKREGAVLRVAY